MINRFDVHHIRNIVALRNRCIVSVAIVKAHLQRLPHTARVARVNHDNHIFDAFVHRFSLSGSLPLSRFSPRFHSRSSPLVLACEPRFRKVMYKRRMTLECSLGVPADRFRHLTCYCDPIQSDYRSNKAQNLAHESSAAFIFHCVPR